jgi:hypothetical protein
MTVKISNKALTGQPWVLEGVYVIRFNNEDKVSDVKAYWDTLHIQNNIVV